MLQRPATPDRVPGYNLEPPLESDAVASLQRVFGAERGSVVWNDACRAAGLFAGRIDSVEYLRRVAVALGKSGGAAASIARSIEIRINTYVRLAARASTTAGARA